MPFFQRILYRICSPVRRADAFYRYKSRDTPATRAECSHGKIRLSTFSRITLVEIFWRILKKGKSHVFSEAKGHRGTSEKPKKHFASKMAADNKFSKRCGCPAFAGDPGTLTGKPASVGHRSWGRTKTGEGKKTGRRPPNSSLIRAAGFVSEGPQLRWPQRSIFPDGPGLLAHGRPGNCYIKIPAFDRTCLATGDQKRAISTHREYPCVRLMIAVKIRVCHPRNRHPMFPTLRSRLMTVPHRREGMPASGAKRSRGRRALAAKPPLYLNKKGNIVPEEKSPPNRVGKSHPAVANHGFVRLVAHPKESNSKTNSLPSWMTSKVGKCGR